jgi:hypothetical protein
MSLKYLSILFVFVSSLFALNSGRLSMSQKNELQPSENYSEDVRTEEKTEGLIAMTSSFNDTLNKNFRYQTGKEINHRDTCEVKINKEFKTQPNNDRESKTPKDEHLTMVDLLIRWFSLLFQSLS